MGTNYYMFIKNKKVARDYFAEVDEYGNVDPEYEIVDEPELGYKIHLNKCSYGWRPLFQIQKAVILKKLIYGFLLIIWNIPERRKKRR